MQSTYQGHTYDNGLAQWVGIGGIYGNLWQAGWDGVSNQFFYEQVGGPNDTLNEVYFGISGASHCGHTGYVYVDENVTFPKGTFAIVEDITSGDYADTTFDTQFRNNYADKETVEWIDERFSCSKGRFQMGDYIQDVWTDPTWEYSNNTSNYAAYGNYQHIKMVGADGNVLSTNTYLAGNESIDTWQHYTTDVQC